MVRLTFAALLIVAALARPVLADQDRSKHQDGEVRHSGRVVEIGADARTLVIEEMLAWHGPQEPGIVRRSIEMTPETAIDRIRRTGEWDDARKSLPGWKSERIDARQLKVGDFVTVTTDDDARSRAVSVELIRPDA